MINNKTIGSHGEQLATEFLIKNGYKIIDRNFRCRFGEIDIIAQEGETLVIVEVKTRYTNSFGSPSECIGFKKRSNMLKTVYVFISNHKFFNCNIRIDALEVILNHKDDSFNIVHLCNI